MRPNSKFFNPHSAPARFAQSGAGSERSNDEHPKVPSALHALRRTTRKRLLGLATLVSGFIITAPSTIPCIAQPSVGINGNLFKDLLCEAPRPAWLNHENQPSLPYLPKGSTLESVIDDGYVFASNGDLGLRKGFCDKSGKVLISAQFDNIDYLGESRLFAFRNNYNGTQNSVLFDTKGRLIANLPSWIQNHPNVYSCGMALLGGWNEGTFIDKSGRVIVRQGEFREMRSFSGGLAYVTATSNGNPAGAYIDTTGKVVLGPFENIRGDDFSEGIAVLSKPFSGNDSKLGAITRDGKWFIPCEFDELRPTQHGILIARKTADIN